MKRNMVKNLLCSALVALTFMGLARRADAGLSLSPMKQEITLRPGEEGKLALTVANRVHDGAVPPPESATISIRDVSVLVGGELDFKNPGTLKNSASNWITASAKEVTLEAGKSQVVELTIKPPAQARPGEYYSAVIVTLAKHGHSDKGVDIEYEIASGVFVTVSGQVLPKQAKISGLEIQWPALPESSALSSSDSPATQPVELESAKIALILQNTGSSRFNASGTVRVISLPTNRVVMTAVMTSLRPCVFGGDSRRFVAPLTKPLAAGTYAIKVDMDYESQWSKANINQTFEITPDQAELLAQMKDRAAGTNLGVTITPQKLEQVIPAGGSRSLGVGIKSTSDLPVRCMLTSTFTGDVDLDSWITLSAQDFVLDAGSHQSVEIKVAVPPDVPAGTYTATLSIETWPKGAEVRRTELPIEITVPAGRK